MAERQRRPGFDGLDGDVAAHFPDDRHVEKLVDQESPATG